MVHRTMQDLVLRIVLILLILPAVWTQGVSVSCGTENGGCEQVCRQGENAATCSCRSGYILSHNDKDCKKCSSHSTFVSDESSRVFSCCDASGGAARIECSPGKKIFIFKTVHSLSSASCGSYSSCEELSRYTSCDERSECLNPADVTASTACNGYRTCTVPFTPRSIPCGGQFFNATFMEISYHCVDDSKFIDVCEKKEHNVRFDTITTELDRYVYFTTPGFPRPTPGNSNCECRLLSDQRAVLFDAHIIQFEAVDLQGSVGAWSSTPDRVHVNEEVYQREQQLDYRLTVTKTSNTDGGTGFIVMRPNLPTLRVDCGPTERVTSPTTSATTTTSPTTRRVVTTILTSRTTSSTTGTTTPTTTTTQTTPRVSDTTKQGVTGTSKNVNAGTTKEINLNDFENDEEKKDGIGVIVGAVIAAVAVTLIILVVIFVYVYRKRELDRSRKGGWESSRDRSRGRGSHHNERRPSQKQSSQQAERQNKKDIQAERQNVNIQADRQSMIIQAERQNMNMNMNSEAERQIMNIQAERQPERRHQPSHHHNHRSHHHHQQQPSSQQQHWRDPAIPSLPPRPRVQRVPSDHWESNTNGSGKSDRGQQPHRLRRTGVGASPHQGSAPPHSPDMMRNHHSDEEDESKSLANNHPDILQGTDNLRDDSGEGVYEDLENHTQFPAFGVPADADMPTGVASFFPSHD